MKDIIDVCDVLVIGGGPAGCAAALEASGCGAKTILIESENYLGGTVESARLTHFCGFFKNDLQSPELLNPHGVSLALTEELKALAYKPVKQGRVWLQPFPEHFIHYFFMPRIKAASSLELSLHSKALEFIISEDFITEVNLSCRSYKRHIKPHAVIDCTGTGLPADKLPHCYYTFVKDYLKQAAAFIFLLKNVKRLDSISHLELLYKIKRAVEAKKLSNICGVSSYENGFISGEIIGRVNLPGDITQKEIESIIQQDLYILLNYLKQNISGFEKAELVIPHAELSHRIGSRIQGRHELTENDILCSKNYDDTNVRAAWPIEEWSAVKGQSICYLQSIYGIPDRSLISATCHNLFAGGGTISSTARAHSSARICGTAFATGERAGYLAARHLRK